MMAPAIVVVGREEGEVRSGSYKRRERPQGVGGCGFTRLGPLLGFSEERTGGYQ